MKNDNETQNETTEKRDLAEPACSDLDSLRSRLKWAQESQALALRILTLLSREASVRDAIGELIGMVKDFTAFEAVGIRLRDGDDFPYFETRGFSAAFVEAETSLCGRTEEGEILRDSAGYPILDCMCGNILQGRTNPALPFFTPGGSFWTNCTTQLLATASEEDRQALTRNRCNGEGYESVALIPLRSDHKIIGLLQLNDSRKDRFTPEMIGFLEGLGVSMGIVLERQRAEEERDRLFNLSLDMLCVAGMDGRYKQVNPAFTRTLGWTEQELLSTPRIEFVHPDDREKTLEAHKMLAGGEPLHYFENRCQHKDGTYRWVSWNCFPIPRENLIFGVARDITWRKSAEDDLRTVRDELEKHVGERTASLKEANERLRVEISERQRVEEALRVEQEQLLALFEGLNAVVLVIDPKTDEILYTNRFTKNLYGKALVGGKCYEELHGSPGPCEHCITEKLCSLHGEPYQWDYHNATVGRDFLATDRMIRWTSGRDAKFHLAIDVTERKKAEDELRESEKRFKNLADLLPQFVFEANEEGFFTFANQAALETTGYTWEHIARGTHLLEIIAPEDAGTAGEDLARILRGEKIIGREYGLKTLDGRIIPTVSYSNPIERDGKVVGFRGVGVDLTERKRAEEELRQAKHYLDRIINSVADPILVKNENHEWVLLNDAYCTFMGYPHDELIGKSDYDFFPKSEADVFWEKDEIVFRTGRENINEENFTDRTGITHTIVTKKSLYVDPAGKKYLVGVVRDVTERERAQAERRQLESRLQQAQKMEAVGTLAGGIAHDFNNLLQVTLGYSELLLLEKSEDDPECADLRKIQQAARSGAELVKGLLTFSRKVESKPIPISLNARIGAVEQLLRRTIPRMTDIRFTFADNLQRVNADPSQIEQVIMNLALNARDAVTEGGSIAVETANVTLDDRYCSLHPEVEPGDYVLLSVSDTGHGMSRETLDHIFEPFYTTKELGRGTGLGLAMVYGIVRQHGGHIACSSEVGKGTRFDVYLPAIAADSGDEADSAGEMPAFGSETILLVDDEDFVRDLGERILRRSGYTVLTAANGMEALDLYAQKRDQIALVVLDLIMPAMGGSECLGELVRIDPQVRVLVASGYAADAARTDCLATGAKGFVSKPFKMKELLQQVRRVLDKA
ncbi:MAG: PAS domain S-box protein [Desulfomonile tiedjei]|nr:PAS domain S-box protein [Desulfomonile tiedjei]